MEFRKSSIFCCQGLWAFSGSGIASVIIALPRSTARIRSVSSLTVGSMGVGFQYAAVCQLHPTHIVWRKKQWQ